jgi:hypothetical protein
MAEVIFTMSSLVRGEASSAKMSSCVLPFFNWRLTASSPEISFPARWANPSSPLILASFSGHQPRFQALNHISRQVML